MKTRHFFGVLGLMTVAFAGALFAMDMLTVAHLTAMLGDPTTAGGLILAESAAVIDPKAILEELGKVRDSLKQHAEGALAEAKKAGDMSVSTKAKVDELLVESGKLQARLQEIEQKQARKGGLDADAPKTAGELFVTDPALKEWVDAGGIKSTQSGFVGSMPRSALTSVGTTNTTTVGVAPDVIPGVFPGTQRRLTIRDLLTPGTTQSNMIQYVKETGFTNNAASVTEGAQKPESTLTYALTQSAVVTIAHWIKASKQILDDFKQLQSNIDGRLRYGLKLVEENQLLKGSGLGNNLNGIYTQATAYAAPAGAPAAPSKIDVIRLMMLQAELAEYPATGIVLHPADWAFIELKKNTQGSYIFANPQALAMPTLWGLPVVATQAMTIDTALVGAFRLGAQVFDREDANVVISTENQDDFIKNMCTIRCEERLALAVYRPEAFIKNADLPAT